MNSLDSLNIRKGLELEVPVSDIFAIKTLGQGDVLAKEVCTLGWEVYSSINPESSKKIIDEGGIIYDSEKKPVKISDTLTAYVYDSYIVYLEPNESDEFDIVTDISNEIEFLNTEILDFDQFCINIMEAQRFTGKYRSPDFKFCFFGYGNFSLEDYVEIHRIVAYSNIQTLNFFIKHRNVVSGISSFLNGLHRSDIIRQREYLTSKEFATLLNDAEAQFELVSSILLKNPND